MVVDAYAYRMGETVGSVFGILSEVLQLGFIVFGVIVGIQVLRACSIYIKEHSQK